MNTATTPITVRELADLAAAEGKTPSEFLSMLTVREAGDMAEARGMKLSEWLGELGPINGL